MLFLPVEVGVFKLEKTAERKGKSEILDDKDRVISNLGGRALKETGINDPLTHFNLYRENKYNNIIKRILLDIKTDIAERLPDTPFFNNVNFYFTENEDDFVSVIDNVSMKKMTKNSADILAIESAYDSKLNNEYERAKIEIEEVTKIIEWFKNAKINSFLVFESLPLGDQKFAVSRIYQKTNETSLSGIFISLYNPSISHFNNFRKHIGGLDDCQTELEILSNHYEFYDPSIDESKDFVDFYVGLYDRLLYEKGKSKYSFGIELSKKSNIKNGLDLVYSQTELTSIYTDTIKLLANCNGKVTSEIMKISNNLGINKPYLKNGQKMTDEQIRDFLSEVIIGITSVIDKADNKLCNLKTKTACYEAVAQYGNEARTQGQNYSSGGCPEINRNNLNQNDQTGEQSKERNVLLWAFGIYENLDDFGIPRHDVCRIPNCPSHGESKYPKKTTVGGCGVCVGCHKIFKQKKSPSEEYKRAKKHKKDEIEVVKSRSLFGSLFG